MKIRIMLCMMVLLLFSVLISMPSKLVFVCEDQEDFPHLMGTGSEVLSEKPGATVDAIRLLGKNLGFEAEFRRVPWRRALEHDLKHGNVDALFVASYNPAREEFGVFPKKAGQIDDSRRLFSLTYSFYRLKGSNIEWDGKTLKDFDGLIDAPRGYSIVNDLKNMSYKVDESTSTTNGFQKMIAGRVQLVAALDFTADNILEKTPEFRQKIEKIELPIISKAYFVIFSHQFYDQYKEFAEKCWDNLTVIRDKEYNKLVSKYLD